MDEACNIHRLLDARRRLQDLSEAARLDHLRLKSLLRNAITAASLREFNNTIYEKEVSVIPKDPETGEVDLDMKLELDGRESNSQFWSFLQKLDWSHR